MKITKRQLQRMIQEAMPAGGVPDVMGAIGGGRRHVGPTVPNDMMSRIKSIDRGDFQDHLYDIVDAIESGADDYTLDMLKKNIEDAERMVKAGTNESTVMKITKRQLRRIIREEVEKAAPFGSGMEQAELEPDQKEIVGHT